MPERPILIACTAPASPGRLALGGHRALGVVRATVLLAARRAGLVLLAAAVPLVVLAQGTDTTTTRPSPSLVVPKPAGGPPITPRRAFLYSLAFPGSAQSILSRPTAGTIFVAAEAGTLAMIAKSMYDLRAARAVANDTVVHGYTTPTDGTQPRPIYVRTAGALRAQSRIPARRAHVEDWITILIVNHFFAGADAYVAANLWDVPTDVSVTAVPSGGAQLAVRLAW
ncbi:MAG: hypothetical protein ACJ79K_05700 [Gemmatimonadaceae bacterium]